MLKYKENAGCEEFLNARSLLMFCFTGY